LPKNRPSKEIAPRLANGMSRVSIGHALPDEIKAGIQAIARHERRSVSWVLENVCYDYFGLKRPKFKPRKTKVEEDK
jgi:hypothetical protein